MADGAVALGIAELEQADWDPILAGAGSAHWRTPPPGFDVAAVTARLRTEAMMGGAYGADTPVWQVFGQTSWQAAGQVQSRAHVVTWVADDRTEQDGQPFQDSNGRLLLRALAFEGEAQAWVEVSCGWAAGGRVRVQHVRAW